MSLVANQLFMNLNTLVRLNGQYGVQQANQNLTNMLARQDTAPLGGTTVRRENRIMFGSLQNQLMAKCAEASEKSLKEQQDKNIKSTFNYFA